MNPVTPHRLSPFVAAFFLFAGAIAAADEQEKIDRLILQLAAPKFEDREQAMKDLIAVGPPALPALRKALESKDQEVVRRAQECILIIEENAKIADLASALQDADPRQRVLAAGELIRLGPKAEAALPALVRALDDADAEVRRRAVVAIGRIGRRASHVIPKLITILKNRKSNDDLRVNAMGALQNMGAAAEQAAPAILEALATGGPVLRVFSAHALGNLGRNNDQVVPALLNALKDEERSVRNAAAGALGLIGKQPNTCVPAIVEALKQYEYKKGVGRDFNPPTGLIVGLGKFGPHAKQAVPILIELLNGNKEDDNLTHVILPSLKHIGPAAKAAIPILEALAKDGSAPLRSCAAQEALDAIRGP